MTGTARDIGTDRKEAPKFGRAASSGYLTRARQTTTLPVPLSPFGAVLFHRATHIVDEIDSSWNHTHDDHSSWQVACCNTKFQVVDFSIKGVDVWNWGATFGREFEISRSKIRRTTRSTSHILASKEPDRSVCVITCSRRFFPKGAPSPSKQNSPPSHLETGSLPAGSEVQE